MLRLLAQARGYLAMELLAARTGRIFSPGLPSVLRVGGQAQLTQSMKIKRVILLSCGFLLLFLVFGCGKSENQSTPASGGGKKLKLAFVSNNASSFWTIARAGCDDAKKELGNVEVDFRIPASGTAAEQRQILDDLAARGIDGIAVSPVDPANQTEFLNKIAERTLLVCHDSDAPASKRVCYIGTDNTAAGIQAGKLIKEALP